MTDDNLKIEDIIKTYLKPIYNFTYRLSGNAEEANDITQEVFIKVWRHLNRYDQSKSFKTWIFTIARRTTIDWLRKRHPILFSQLDQIEQESSFSDNLIDNQPLPAELFEQSQLREILEKALMMISVDQRTVISLHLESDLTFKDIAQVSGRSIDTVKSQYRRGLIALRQYLHQF